jgi:hypothetical protein
MQDLCWALDYIKEQFDMMTGGKAAWLQKRLKNGL